MLIPVTGAPLGRVRLLEVYHSYDGPKLFACIAPTDQRYLVLWLGDEDEQDLWLCVPVSETRLQQVRSGGISLRSACLNPESGTLWRVATEALGKIASYRVVLPEELPDLDLPAEGAALDCATETIPQVLETPALRAIQTGRDVWDYALEPEGSLRNEVGVGVLSRSLQAAQQLLESLVASQEGYKSKFGKIPLSVKADAELVAVGAFPSSFGLRLQSKVHADLFGTSKVGFAIRDLFTLVSLRDDAEKLKETLGEMGGRVAARYAVFLTALSSGKTDLKMAWASPTPEPIEERVDLSWKEAASVTERLLATIEELTEEFSIPVRLEGVNVHNKTFDLLALGSLDRYTGRIEDSLVEAANKAAARVPAEYQAKIVQTQRVNAVTGEVTESYRLLALNEIQSGKVVQ